jgi:AcrR family transcriptional regulator
MQEAGFSKPLLYDYFGNMTGLAAAWAENHALWPDHQYPDDTVPPTEFALLLKDFLLSTANGLRENPVALELLAAEIGPPTEYQTVLEESRKRWFRQNMKGMLSHPEIQEPDNWNLLFVCYSAISYLVLRSRRAAPHNGFQLDTDEGWAEAMHHVEQFIDELALLARLKRILKDGKSAMLAEMLDALEKTEAGEATSAATRVAGPEDA